MAEYKKSPSRIRRQGLKDIISKSLNLLEGLFEYPSLSFELLRRPPFAYLRAITLSLLDTGDIGEDLFSHEEAENHNPTAETKIVFITKITSFIAFCSGVRVDLYVDPVSVITGQNAAATHLLIQQLATIVQQATHKNLKERNTEIIKTERAVAIVNKYQAPYLLHNCELFRSGMILLQAAVRGRNARTKLDSILDIQEDGLVDDGNESDPASLKPAAEEESEDGNIAEDIKGTQCSDEEEEYYQKVGEMQSMVSNDSRRSKRTLRSLPKHCREPTKITRKPKSSAPREDDSEETISDSDAEEGECSHKEVKGSEDSFTYRSPDQTYDDDDEEENVEEEQIDYDKDEDDEADGWPMTPNSQCQEVDLGDDGNAFSSDDESDDTSAKDVDEEPHPGRVNQSQKEEEDHQSLTRVGARVPGDRSDISSDEEEDEHDDLIGQEIRRRIQQVKDSQPSGSPHSMKRLPTDSSPSPPSSTSQSHRVVEPPAVIAPPKKHVNSAPRPTYRIDFSLKLTNPISSSTLQQGRSSHFITNQDTEFQLTSFEQDMITSVCQDMFSLLSGGGHKHPPPLPKQFKIRYENIDDKSKCFLNKKLCFLHGHINHLNHITVAQDYISVMNSHKVIMSKNANIGPMRLLFLQSNLSTAEFKYLLPSESLLNSSQLSEEEQVAIVNKNELLKKQIKLKEQAIKDKEIKSKQLKELEIETLRKEKIDKEMFKQKERQEAKLAIRQAAKVAAKIAAQEAKKEIESKAQKSIQEANEAAQQAEKAAMKMALEYKKKLEMINSKAKELELVELEVKKKSEMISRVADTVRRQKGEIDKEKRKQKLISGDKNMHHSNDQNMEGQHKQSQNYSPPGKLTASRVRKKKKKINRRSGTDASEQVMRGHEGGDDSSLSSNEDMGNDLENSCFQLDEQPKDITNPVKTTESTTTKKKKKKHRRGKKVETSVSEEDPEDRTESPLKPIALQMVRDTKENGDHEELEEDEVKAAREAENLLEKLSQDLKLKSKKQDMKQESSHSNHPLSKKINNHLKKSVGKGSIMKSRKSKPKPSMKFPLIEDPKQFKKSPIIKESLTNDLRYDKCRQYIDKEEEEEDDDAHGSDLSNIPISLDMGEGSRFQDWLVARHNHPQINVSKLRDIIEQHEVESPLKADHGTKNKKEEEEEDPQGELFQKTKQRNSFVSKGDGSMRPSSDPAPKVDSPHKESHQRRQSSDTYKLKTSPMFNLKENNAQAEDNEYGVPIPTSDPPSLPDINAHITTPYSSKPKIHKQREEGQLTSSKRDDKVQFRIRNKEYNEVHPVHKTSSKSSNIKQPVKMSPRITPRSIKDKDIRAKSTAHNHHDNKHVAMKDEMKNNQRPKHNQNSKPKKIEKEKLKSNEKVDLALNIKNEIRGNHSKVGAVHPFSNAEHWMNGFDSRFDDALKKLGGIEHF